MMKHFALLVPYYFRWHYSFAYVDILRIWTNYMWFFWNFFSIPLLFKTLTEPWRRLKEEKTRTFSFENFLTRLVVNSIMRVVGVFVRLAVVASGLAILLLIFISGLMLLVFWTAIPFLLVFVFFYAFIPLIS